MNYRPRNLERHDAAHYRAPCDRLMLSDDLEESNFAACLARLGGPSETVVVVREPCRLVGWFEIILIDKRDAVALRAADKAADDLDQYPYLDELDFSHREGIRELSR